MLKVCLPYSGIVGWKSRTGRKLQISLTHRKFTTEFWQTGENFGQSNLKFNFDSKVFLNGNFSAPGVAYFHGWKFCDKKKFLDQFLKAQNLRGICPFLPSATMLLPVYTDTSA